MEKNIGKVAAGTTASKTTLPVKGSGGETGAEIFLSHCRRDELFDSSVALIVVIRRVNYKLNGRTTMLNFHRAKRLFLFSLRFNVNP